MSPIGGIVNLSFSGAGFLGIYQLGAAAGLRHVLGAEMGSGRVATFIGTSFGSVAAMLLAAGMDPGSYAPLFIDAARDTRRRPLRSLTPGFYPAHYVRDAMLRELPADAHERCTGRLYVSLSVRQPGERGLFENRLISQYPTREYLAEALCAACWIPGLTGRLLPLPELGEHTVMDGTLTATLAPCNRENPHPTLFVSPFSSARFSICPEHTGSHLRVKIPTGREFNLNTWNLRALLKAVWTPTDEDLNKFYRMGWEDTMRYFERQHQAHTQQQFAGGASPRWLPDIATLRTPPPSLNL